jgi:F-type H+-transporting ATPase subunit b
MALKKSLLGLLTFAVALGIGFYLRERPVAAQAKSDKSAPRVVPESMGQREIEIDENAEYRKSPMVRKIGAMLGMDPDRAADVFEFANFALLAVGVVWLVVKVVPKMYPELVPRNRTQVIQRDLTEARSATEEARARLSSVEERLSRLDGEIAAIRTQAEQDSAKEEERIRASVEEEKKKILASADQEIAAATMHAQKQLQQHAAELAIEQAARKLVVSAETDRLLVQGFAQRLTGDESKKGQN